MERVHYEFCYPLGILDCKNFEEYILLHLFEHILARNVISFLGISSKSIQAGTALDHFGFKINLNLGKNKILRLYRFLRNFQINQINKKDFEIEKARIFEEEKLKSLDFLTTIKNYVFFYLFNNFDILINTEKTLELIKKTNTSDLFIFCKKYIDFKKLYIFKFHNNLELINKLENFYKPRYFAISSLPTKINKNKLDLEAVIYLILIKPTIENIFFTEILVNKIDNFLREEVNLKHGLAYTYYIHPSFSLLSHLFYLFIIPSTRVNKIKKILLMFKNKLKITNRDIKKEKAKILKRTDYKILRLFKPSVVYHLYSTKQILKTIDIKKIIKRISSRDLKTFDFKDNLSIIS